MAKKYDDRKISILNRIKHKPILFDNIFPLIEKRPMFFPYLIDNDLILKEKLNPIIEPASINNKLSKNINDNICKFILSKLLYEINFEPIKKDIKDKIINHSNEDNSFLPTFFYNFENIPFYLKKSVIKYIFEKVTELLKKKVNSIINIDIKYSKAINNFYKSKNYINYIFDYMHIQKEMVLLHLLSNNKKNVEDDAENEEDMDKNEYYYLKWQNAIIYVDSYYLDNLNKNINQKIDLICKIDNNKYYNNPSLITYDNIYKLNFNFYEDDKSKDKIEHDESLFDKINYYLMAIKHKENIEEIYFNNAFFLEEKSGNFYEKIYFEQILGEFEEKVGNQEFIFKSLKKIEFNDDKIKNNIRRFKLRYNLNKIFGFHVWTKINIINYKDINNLLYNVGKEKQYNIMQKFIVETTTNLKIILIDLEYNSPFQKYFYDFCKIYLDNNKNINMIVFHRIGNINYDKNFDKNIQKKIIIPNLTAIYYERDINDKNSINQVYVFIKAFFDISKLFMVYEGYDDNNNLNYLNISSNDILEDEINRIILEQNICSFNLKRENIQIKYNKKKNHLIIKNNNKEKNLDNNKYLSFFSNAIRGLNNLQKLTINGFDFSFYDLINNNISVLSINSLNEFVSKNYKHINKYNKKDFENDWKDFKSFEYLQLFENMKYLIISENVKLLDEIIKYVTKNQIKKIKFYTSDKIDKKYLSIIHKYKMKNIFLEIVQTNKKNVIFENEENIDKEEEKYYEIGNKKIHQTKKKLIENINWFNSFNSQILQNLGSNYIKRILDLFSKIYPKVCPYHFCLLKRYKVSKKNKLDKKDEETLLKPYLKVNNLLIIIDSKKKGDYFGVFKVEYFNNTQGIIFYDKGKNEISYQKVSKLKLSVSFCEEWICLDASYYDSSFYPEDESLKCKSIEVFEIKIN